MQLDPSQNQRRAHFHAADLVADAERRRMAKVARDATPGTSTFFQARRWAGAAFVRIGELLQGTVSALPETEVSANPEPRSAM